MRSLPVTLLLAILAATVATTAPAEASVRIKDIATIGGLRDNQLVGYGLVVGLLGTGDTMRNAPFTEQSVQSMLDRMGVNVRGISLRNRNVAAVIVTANLPALAGRGMPLDVTVSALGDSISLMGRHPDHDPFDGRRRADPRGGARRRLGLGFRGHGTSRNLYAGRADRRAASPTVRSSSARPPAAWDPAGS